MNLNLYPMNTKKKSICKACGKEYQKYNSTQKACSIECALSLAKVISEKKIRQEVQKEKKELKKVHDDWKPLLQAKINQIARFIDYGQPCTAKGLTTGQMHGGHLNSVGSSANMRFNLHNIFIQSAHSNHWQNDDHLMREGVKNTFGEDYLKFILELKRTPVPKYSNQEYYEFLQVANKIANELKNNLQILSPKERISKRNELNLRLGIYEKEYIEF